MSDSDDFQASCAAVLAAARTGDVKSNQFLHSLVEHSLDFGNTNALYTIAPQLLRWCLDDAVVREDAAALTFIALLNRVFCTTVLLRRLAQPLDRRPVGLAELQSFYSASLSQCSLNSGAARQLLQCIACLMVVSVNNIADSLEELLHQDSTKQQSQLGLRLTISAMDLLLDHRIPIGSICRATQRHKLQSRIDLVLRAPLTSEADTPLLIQATLKAVEFLLEAMTEEPQEVAADFWAALPSSTVWRCCLNQLEAAASMPYLEDVTSLVCRVLRCLTIIDDAAEQLICQSLSTVLRQPSPALLSVEVRSEILSAALEGVTEEVILKEDPQSNLFQLVSAAAQQLVALLQAPDAPLPAVRNVCEGVSALSQVLQQDPIPTMEPTDDPEDFECVVALMVETNRGKSAALSRLGSFLVECRLSLAARLAQSGFTNEQWESIASYVRTQLAQQEVDYQIKFDEVELALFTTYERLCRLLGPLTAEEVALAAPDVAQRLIVVLCDSQQSVEWIQSASLAPLLSQSALLPILVARFSTMRSNTVAWPSAILLSVSDAFSRALAEVPLASTNSLDSLGVSHLEAAMADAVQRLHQMEAVDPHQLQQLCEPLASSIWHRLQGGSGGTGGGPLAAEQRRSAVRLGTLLGAGLVRLTEGHIVEIHQLDRPTQAILFSFASLVSRLEELAHVLVGISELLAEEEEDAVHSIVEILQVQASQHCASGQWDASAFLSCIMVWHEQHPDCIQPFLRLCTAVPLPFQSTALMSGLTRYFAISGSSPISTRELCSLLQRDVVQSISHDSTAAAHLTSLLQWLLQPDPSFSAADGCRRVWRLATCGCLLWKGRQVKPELMMECLVAAVERWRESASAAVFGQPEDLQDLEPHSGEGDSTDDADVPRLVLEELASWGECTCHVAAVPVNSPAWLSCMCQSTDDFERLEVLKKRL